jgi:hypothetical protein
MTEAVILERERQVGRRITVLRAAQPPEAGRGQPLQVEVAPLLAVPARDVPNNTTASTSGRSASRPATLVANHGGRIHRR